MREEIKKKTRTFTLFIYFICNDWRVCPHCWLCGGGAGRNGLGSAVVEWLTVLDPLDLDLAIDQLVYIEHND